MTAEQPMAPADLAATKQWLDGVAGRPGSGADHAEGARARAALVLDAQDAPRASWQDIEARAKVRSDASAAPPPAEAPAVEGVARHEPAANEGRPLRWLAWAAALLMGVGLVTLMLPGPGPDSASRAVAGDGSQGAQWLVERPAQAADALAAELRALQVEVTMTQEGDATVMLIRAPRDAWDAVNARLLVLETGLDAEGWLRLVVRPAR